MVNHSRAGLYYRQKRPVTTFYPKAPFMKHLYFLPLLFVYSLPAHAISCNELSQFLLGLAATRAILPELTASRAKQSLQNDPSFSGAEKRVLAKYVDRSFAKSDPAEGAFVPIDRGDCTK